MTAEERKAEIARIEEMLNHTHGRIHLMHALGKTHPKHGGFQKSLGKRIPVLEARLRDLKAGHDV